MAALGGEYGGLSSLAPAFQQATAATAALNPETAAQVVQAANAGAMPPAGADFGWNPMDLATKGQGAGDIAAAQAGSGFQNAGEFRTMTDAETADVMKDVNPAFRNGYMPDATSTTDMARNAQDASNWANRVDPWAQEMNPGGMNTDFVPGDPRASVPSVENMVDATTGKMPGSSPWSGLKALTQPVQDWWKDQNDLTKYGLGGYGALQAAKYLNKPQGVAAPEKYNGPLSKFSYSPDTYKPYVYKPYAAGGPVEEMSRENAIGANTGYPQADINQGAYATPWQTPVSRNVVSGASDANVDQMTGMERMAEGGETTSAPADAKTDQATPVAAAPVANAGLPALSAAAQALPEVAASRQNFVDFLQHYQNLPITPVAGATNMPVSASNPVTYQGLTATTSGAGENLGKWPSGAPYVKGDLWDPWWPAASGDGSSYGGAAGGRVSPAGFGSGGGIASLGGYSDGGRLLRGPGDGMSDNIPANISGKQPARLADGEFVVPADVVSGLGNGSTEAGAKQLYKMLDKVRAARTGTKKQGKQIKAQKYMPA